VSEIEDKDEEIMVCLF